MGVKRFVWKVISRHNRATDECLERKCGQHVQAKATGGYQHKKIQATRGLEVLQSGNVDQDVIRWEVVEHIPLSLRAEGKESGDAHGQTHDQRYRRRVMGHCRKAVKCWFLQ